MQPSLLNLINTVHDDGRDHWMSRRDKIHQSALKGRRKSKKKKMDSVTKTWKILSQEFTAKIYGLKTRIVALLRTDEETSHPSAQRCIACPELPPSPLNAFLPSHPYTPSLLVQ